MNRLLLACALLTVQGAVMAAPSLFRKPEPGADAAFRAVAGNLRNVAATDANGPRVRPVRLDPEALAASAREGGLWIELSGRQRVFARFEHMRALGDGNVAWTGTVRLARADHPVLIVQGRDAVFGSLVAADGSPIELETRRGVGYLIAYDPDKRAELQYLRKHIKDYVEAEPTTPSSAERTRTSQALAAAGESPTIDVVIGYTPAMVARFGSDSAAVTRLTYLTAVTNQAYQTSGALGRIRLLATMRVNFSDTVTNSEALSRLRDGGSGPGGDLEAMRAARLATGADVAVLVRPFNSPGHGDCGRAPVNGSNLNPYTTAAFAKGGFAVVSDGSDISGETDHFCRLMTLAHELGHAMGLVHDAVTDDHPGAFPYTYGWRQTLPSGSFCTIMAYCEKGQSDKRYFANPNITYCSGYPCGDPISADQARALNQTMVVMAAFNTPPMPVAAAFAEYGMRDLRVSADAAEAPDPAR